MEFMFLEFGAYLLFPVLWQYLIQLINIVHRNSFQYIFEPVERIDIMLLASAEKRSRTYKFSGLCASFIFALKHNRMIFHFIPWLTQSTVVHLHGNSIRYLENMSKNFFPFLKRY